MNVCMHCHRIIDGSRKLSEPGGGPVPITAHILVAAPFRMVGEEQAWRNVERRQVIVCAYCARHEVQGVAGSVGVIRFVACIGGGCHWCGDWDKRDSMMGPGRGRSRLRQGGL